MSKTVLFFRHAKSDWNANYLRDHDRPLNSRGKRAAGAMGRWLVQFGPLPELILCSTATRARSTYTLASKAGAWTSDVQYERELYHAMPQDLLHYLQEIPGDIQTVMLIGHQPTWSMTVALLSNQSIDEFPTASMARVDLQIDHWEHSVPRAGKLVWHQFPKRLAMSFYE
ncbi:MAG: histidine phosphatase family protein [Bacteroidetes bacterium]|nr:histidine phosphatase family protein [Bacteroidota bacterium]MCY4206190.1 histidine phosphatase family protein [Bacteroidota bacterium]